jgi:hypothetical protein
MTIESIITSSHNNYTVTHHTHNPYTTLFTLKTIKKRTITTNQTIHNSRTTNSKSNRTKKAHYHVYTLQHDKIISHLITPTSKTIYYLPYY